MECLFSHSRSITITTQLVSKIAHTIIQMYRKSPLTFKAKFQSYHITHTVKAKIHEINIFQLNNVASHSYTNCAHRQICGEGHPSHTPVLEDFYSLSYVGRRGLSSAIVFCKPPSNELISLIQIIITHHFVYRWLKFPDIWKN